MKSSHSFRTAAALLASLLLAAPAFADADSSYEAPVEETPLSNTPPPDTGEEVQGVYPGDVIMDVLVVRPFAFVGTAVGAILFVPAAALTSPGGMSAIRTALDQFVLVPWEYAAERPLGEF
jgi:hypothetical protein